MEPDLIVDKNIPCCLIEPSEPSESPLTATNSLDKFIKSYNNEETGCAVKKLDCENACNIDFKFPISHTQYCLGKNSFSSSVRRTRILNFYAVAKQYNAVQTLVERYVNNIENPLSINLLKRFVHHVLLRDDEMAVRPIDIKHKIIVAVLHIILEINWDVPGALLLSDFAVEGIVTKALFPHKSCCCSPYLY
jgi:hypothetical protein